MDIEKMIANCEENKKAGDSIVFAIGGGRIVPKFGKRKETLRVMREINQLPGLVGYLPIDIEHTLLLFESLNEAKMGRNILKSKNIYVNKDLLFPLLLNENRETALKIAISEKGARLCP